MSSGGYSVVFRSVFSGSLFGKYPDTAAWLFLLALADKHGVVDATPQYIAGVTGMPIDDLLGCIERFLEPDPASRTKENEGRRLELVDANRPWGWRIVNFAAYRERARLMAKNADEISSGKNRARLNDRRRPPETAGERLSDADADKEKNPGSAGDSGSETPKGTLWAEGIRLVLSWHTSKRQSEEAVRSWIGSLLKSGQWFERSNGHDYPIRDRESKLLELIQAASDKRDPKAYVAGAVKQITGLRIV